MVAGLATDQYKRSIADYRQAAQELFDDMCNNGFDYSQAIPVDVDGEILGGAHRIACALAVGIDDIPVVLHERKVWAPPWGEAWFRQNGYTHDEVETLRQVMRYISDGTVNRR